MMPSAELLEHVASEVAPLAVALGEAFVNFARVGPEREEAQAVAQTAQRLTLRLTHWRRRGVSVSQIEGLSASMAGAVGEVEAVLSPMRLWTLRPGSALSAMRKWLMALVDEIEAQIAE